VCVYLDPGAGVQHDVLDGALDVLRPGHQPGHLVVMPDLLPPGPGGRLGVLGVPVGQQARGAGVKYIYSYTGYIYPSTNRYNSAISAAANLRNHSETHG